MRMINNKYKRLVIFFKIVDSNIISTKMSDAIFFYLSISKSYIYNILFMSNNYDFLFKFIIIGDTNVGKSCLLLRFTEGRYKSQHQPTLGVEFGSKNIKISDQVIKVQIWDTAGQQSFKSITRSYYKGSIAALIVYDITKRDTFDNILKWLHEVKTHSHEKVQIVLIGNKSDLNERRQITYEQGQKLAKKNGFQFFETSAFNGDKVEEVFKMLAARIVKKIQNREINPENQSSYGFRRGKKNNSPTRKDANIQIQKPSIANNINNQNEQCKC